MGILEIIIVGLVMLVLLIYGIKSYWNKKFLLGGGLLALFALISDLVSMTGGVLTNIDLMDFFSLLGTGCLLQFIYNSRTN